MAFASAWATVNSSWSRLMMSGDVGRIIGQDAFRHHPHAAHGQVNLAADQLGVHEALD
jgi:hypothetical protein